MSPRNSFAVLVALVMLTACGEGVPRTPNMTERRYENLIKMGRKDLSCRQVSYQYLGEDFHRMVGCNSQVDYLLYCDGGRVCSWVPSPVGQAAFEMNCPASQLRLMKVQPAMYGVDGCGKRRSYTLNDRTWMGADLGGASP